MSLVPDVPDMSPRPVQPPVSVGQGKPHGIAALAHSVGKPQQRQNHGSVVGRQGAGLNGAGGGNQAAQAAGHYGKKVPAPFAAMAGATPVKPVSEHPGTKIVKGSAGGMHGHVRGQALGMTKRGVPDPQPDNSVSSSGDIE